MLLGYRFDPEPADGDHTTPFIESTELIAAQGSPRDPVLDRPREEVLVGGRRGAAYADIVVREHLC